MTRHRLTISAALTLFAALLLFGGPTAALEQKGGGPRQAGPDSLRQDFPELFELTNLREARMDIREREVPLGDILRRLAAEGQFELVLGDVEVTRPVSFVTRNSSLRQALATLARSSGLWYEVVDGRLVVHELRGVGGAIRVPERVAYVAPEYPAEARREQIQGVVIMEAVVGTSGLVERTSVINDSPQLLQEAARAAAQEWVYTPTFVDGAAVKVRIVVTVQFRLQ